LSFFFFEYRTICSLFAFCAWSTHSSVVFCPVLLMFQWNWK
jgi:hypothetical protein